MFLELCRFYDFHLRMQPEHKASYAAKVAHLGVEHKIPAVRRRKAGSGSRAFLAQDSCGASRKP